jgi:hypothetical protein
MRERFADALVACIAVAKTESIRSLAVIVSFGSLYFSRRCSKISPSTKAMPMLSVRNKGDADAIGTRGRALATVLSWPGIKKRKVGLNSSIPRRHRRTQLCNGRVCVPPWSCIQRIGLGYRENQLFFSCISTC